MNGNHYQAFVFDMDGTIVSSIEDIGDAVNYSLAFHGLPTHSMEDYPAFLGNGSVKLIQRALGPEKLDRFQEVFDTYYQYYLKHFCVKTHPYDGIRESLDHAKDLGIRLFVYTNKPDAIAREVSDHCFGPNYFDAIVGIPLGGKVKPDPQAFFDKVTIPFGLDMRKCAYFGDSITDILTARNLGIADMYSVSWGYVGRDRLLANDPAPFAMLDDPHDIGKVAEKTIL